MELETSIIYCGDCLKKLKEIPDESIDLIYIDPPFSSNRNYVAFWQEQEKRSFEDRFKGMDRLGDVKAYLDYMRPRLKELYRVLKKTGSFYYHCDWHASHYVKMLLDTEELFGIKNFQNEIVWFYRTGGATKRRFARKHDIIFFYSKTDVWGFYPQKEKSFQSHKYGYKFPKYEIDEATGKQYSWVYPRDVWEITMGTGTGERLGFPTQKPEVLLERIIRASSKEGDIILDAFCGCGTTLVVAQREKRNWVGIDISPTACRVVAKSLKDKYGLKEGIDFYIRDLPKTAEELRQYPPFEFQNWAINALGGVPSRVKVRNGGIDGKVYPVELKKERVKGIDLFGDIDRYIPIQVKRTDQVGRPDIEIFEVAMKRDKRDRGIFIGFDFSRDAKKEIRRAERDEGLEIEMITVRQILEGQLDKELK